MEKYNLIKVAEPNSFDRNAYTTLNPLKKSVNGKKKVLEL